MKRRKLRLQAIIALVIVIIIFIGVAIYLIINKKPAASISFKEKITTIEYGVSPFDTSLLVESFQADEVVYPNVDTSKIGKQTLTFILKTGKKEKAVEYTVEIKDTQKPEIKLRSESVDVTVNSSYDLAANVESVTDKVDGNIAYKETISKDEVNYYTIKGDVNLTKVGQYTVTIEAVDKNGNHTSTTYVLNVKETSHEIASGDIEPTYINGILIVNKKYGIPKDFGGWDDEALNALYALQAGANNVGYEIPLISGYRSYDYQVGLYNDYVATDGKEAADRYSARPGYSEHQTGLCFDIGAVDDNYGTTVEGKWLAAHAHEYGFIIRYPEGKENITGYMYEPWHVRYVGVNVATEIYNSKTTLEEYLGVSG